LEIRQDIVSIRLILDHPSQSNRHLIIRRLLFPNDDSVLDFKHTRSRLRIILLVVNKNEKRIAKTVDSLASRF